MNKIFLNCAIKAIFTALVAACQPLSAQLLLNEVYVNPPGADEPYEFIELRGTPGTTLNNIYVVVFEGDSASAGNSDLVIPLNNVTIGSSGLILICTTLAYPNVNVGTTVKDTLIFGIPGGYLENGNTSFVVLFSPLPILSGVDYDTNNDGTLDLPSGAVLQDAMGWNNGDATALIYGGVSLTQSAGTPDAAARFYANTTAFSLAAWYNGDITDSGEFDPLEVSNNMPAEGALSPGSHNPPNNVSVGKMLQSSDLEFYPNPCNELLKIKINSGFSRAQINIYDLQGKLVLNRLVADGNVNEVNDFRDGLYFLEVTSEKERVSRTFSVVH